MHGTYDVVVVMYLLLNLTLNIYALGVVAVSVGGTIEISHLSVPAYF